MPEHTQQDDMIEQMGTRLHRAEAQVTDLERALRLKDKRLAVAEKALTRAREQAKQWQERAEEAERQLKEQDAEDDGALRYAAVELLRAMHYTGPVAKYSRCWFAVARALGYEGSFGDSRLWNLLESVQAATR